MRLPVFTFSAVLLLDQLTKYLVAGSFVMGVSRQVIPGLSLTYVLNTGTLWGLMQDANTLFILLSVLALGFLAYYRGAFRTPLQQLCFSLLLAGIMGNRIDRVVHGAVIDFIDLGWWPVFNIADSALTIGILVCLIPGQNSLRSSSLSR